MTGAHTLNYGLYCFRLLVGAPAARTAQPGVNRGGSVFRCEISRDDSCQEIQFDRKGQLQHSFVDVVGSEKSTLSKIKKNCKQLLYTPVNAKNTSLDYINIK